MYSETITLFNRHHSRSGDMWYPHVLKNVEFVADKASLSAKLGTESTDNAKLHVKYEGNLLINGLQYLPPKEWAKQTVDKLADTITFNSDSNYFDFFILGEYDTAPISDDDFIEGFYNEMQKKKDYCYAITSVSSPYRLIPHFEILAK